MIVKVQRALLTDAPKVLIYNEDRSVAEQWEGELAVDTIARMGKNCLKAFFKASHIKGTLCLDRKVADREW